MLGSGTGSVEFQYLSTKALLIIASYEVESPRNGAFDKVLSTESRR